MQNINLEWVMKTSCFALNDHMGFYSDCNIPEFIINIPDLTKKRIVLYGAGRMGKDYKKQIEQLDCQIILWVDKNYELYREKGMEVAEPLKLLDEDYDVILIAIGKEETAIEIGDMLLGMGVEKSKILWRKPMQVF